MKITTQKIFGLFCFTALISPTIQAETISIGAGATFTDSQYKGYGSVVIPFPNVNYESEHFYFKNVSAGYYLINDDMQKVNIGIYYLPLFFKPGDSDDRQMKQLNKRHSTIMADVGYSLFGQWGRFHANLSTDILNESQSIIANVGYSYTIKSDSWTLTPGMGTNWSNDKHNDYYYGVSRKESNRSGLGYHDAKSSFTPYAQILGSYSITKHFGAFGGVRVDWLTGDAKDSPMVANSAVPTVFAGLNYYF